MAVPGLLSDRITLHETRASDAVDRWAGLLASPAADTPPVEGDTEVQAQLAENSRALQQTRGAMLAGLPSSEQGETGGGLRDCGVMIVA